MPSYSYWDLAEQREYVRDEAGRFAETGASATTSAPGTAVTGMLSSVSVLAGVDLRANADAQVEAQLTRHFDLTGEVPDPAKVRAAEAELRALPLVHGTSVAGALGAMEDGLRSYAAMQANARSLLQESEDLRTEISANWPVPDDWSNWDADEIQSSLGLDRRDAEELAGKIADLRDIDAVLMGSTNVADRKLGLDQFVFMSHGAKHQDYGNVGVIIDNAVIKDSVATERDIIAVPGVTSPEFKDTYAPEGVEQYRKLLVQGDDYYRVAAAAAGNPEMLPFRSRQQLFEVKAPTVPKSAVLGFVVYGDLDEAQRLSDKLARQGHTNKVLYVEEPTHSKYAPYVHEQLKTLQRTGRWDTDAAEEREAEAGAGGTFVLREYVRDDGGRFAETEGAGVAKGAAASGEAGGGGAAVPGEYVDYGEASEHGKATQAAREAKLATFHELVGKIGDEEAKLNVLRDDMQTAWKAWVEDVQNHRPKPLKPDGAAAKKLDSYKAAKALEEAFHKEYETTSQRQQMLAQEVKNHLKVPEDERSTVRFVDSPTNPLHPRVAEDAQRSLAVLRQYDGSGAFTTMKFPADKVAQFREVFGDDTPLQENADGTYSTVAKLTLAKSTTGRAYATMGEVHLTAQGDRDGAVFHEVAHHIEFNRPRVLAAAIALRESLADKPREEYSLRGESPALGEDERALRGRFPDRYSGKVYPHDLATEIISTGVESYLADPISFARDRPEHFQLVFDVLHGKYREAWEQ